MYNLEEKSDKELVLNIKNDINTNDSLGELVSRHQPLFQDIVNKFSGKLSSSGVFPKDIYDDRFMVFYQTALNFNEEKKTKFSTWLGERVKYLCLNSINLNSKIKRKEENFSCETALGSLFDEESINNFFKEQSKENKAERLQVFHETLQESKGEINYNRFTRIIQDRFQQERKNTPWKTVGESVNLSQQGVINAFEKDAKTIRKKMLTKLS